MFEHLIETKEKEYISSDKKFKYKIGVIDFLTRYGSMKKAETRVNNVIHWGEYKEVSC
jgi:hypothetical protein